jgi:hypothetical protein
MPRASNGGATLANVRAGGFAGVQCWEHWVRVRCGTQEQEHAHEPWQQARVGGITGSGDQ